MLRRRPPLLPLLVVFGAPCLAGCLASDSFDGIVFLFGLFVTGLVGLVGILGLVGIVRDARAGRRTSRVLLVAVTLVGISTFVVAALGTEGFRPWPASLGSDAFTFLWIVSPAVLAVFAASAGLVYERTHTRTPWIVAGLLACVWPALLVLAHVSNMRPRLEGRIVTVAVSDQQSYGLTDHGQLLALRLGRALPGRYRALRTSATATLAIDEGGRVVFFPNAYDEPLVLPIQGPARALAVDDERACVVDRDGTPACLPLTLGRSLASHPRASSVGPAVRVLEGVTDAREISVAHDTVCAVDGAQTIHCDAFGTVEEVGHGRSPVILEHEACFIDVSGTVHCPATPEARAPALDALPFGATRVEELVAGRFHLCARTENGDVLCAGGNGWSQLARADAKSGASHSGVKIALGGRARALFGFDRSTCARLEDGRISCWGAQREPGTLLWTRVCDEPLLAPNTRCADEATPIHLPTTFIPYRRTPPRAGR